MSASPPAKESRLRALSEEYRALAARLREGGGAARVAKMHQQGKLAPRERVERAYALVDEGDALLVAGSSLTVQSGLRFVRHAAQAGKPVVVVNRGATRGDRYATVTLNAGTSETLDELAQVLPSPHTGA